MTEPAEVLAPAPAQRAEERVATRLLARNPVSAAFFARESHRLAETCRMLAGRFLAGGRLLACGRGAWATDAQHVAVEFVHPVLVGKRALPALDVSPLVECGLGSLVRPDDLVFGFAPPGGDFLVRGALTGAAARGARTLSFAATRGEPGFAPATADPFVHQEIVEVLYHTLWETVHVFLEHRERGHDVGASSFLYPFLGATAQDAGALLAPVAESIVAKAAETARLRERVAEGESRKLAGAAARIAERVARGGTLFLFGNGGSATDANDWALDCIAPPAGLAPLPAVSLAAAPAELSALANDVGIESVFARPLLAHARPGDVAIAISTSGGSANVRAALAAARTHGLLTVALLGYDGGEIARRGLADVAIVVPSDYVPRIQEVQASVYHVLTEEIGAS